MNKRDKIEQFIRDWIGNYCKRYNIEHVIGVGSEITDRRWMTSGCPNSVEGSVHDSLIFRLYFGKDRRHGFQTEDELAVELCLCDHLNRTFENVFSHGRET